MEDFKELTCKEIVALEISWKLSMDTLHSEMMSVMTKMLADLKTKEMNTGSIHDWHG